MTRRSLAALLLVACSATPCAAQVVISQVHTGSLTYTHDFIELYNKGSASVSVTGWALQFADTTSGSFNQFVLAGTIPARGYFLIQTGAAFGATPLPTPDNSGEFLVTQFGGKLALTDDNVPLFTSCPFTDAMRDLVGFGTTNCAENAHAAPGMNATDSLQRAAAGCTDTDDNAADFALAAAAPRNSSNLHNCAGFEDCNSNTIDDFAEILANPALDCDSNLELDSCESAGNPQVDCNGNGRPDSCDIAADPSLDCNSNGVIDCSDLRSGVLTDANANATPDSCEGAAVAEASLTASVLPSGVFSGPATNWFAQGTAIEDEDGRPAPAYGAARWPVTSLSAQLDVTHGVGQWEVTAIYLHLNQANGVTTSAGPVQLLHTNNDTIDLSPGLNPPRYNTFGADYPGAAAIASWAFSPGANGTAEDRLMYQFGGANTAGGVAVESEIAASTGTLTLLLKDSASSVAATYAGRDNASWAGPTLVVFGRAISTCGSADFDGDGDTGTDADIEAFFACLGGNCCGTCGSADFDGDGDTGTDADIEAFFRVLGGGTC